jgi:hypothetical protein
MMSTQLTMLLTKHSKKISVACGDKGSTDHRALPVGFHNVALPLDRPFFELSCQPRAALSTWSGLNKILQNSS